MNLPAIILLVALLSVLLYVRFLKQLLAHEQEEANGAYAKWRHVENQLGVMTAKTTRLIGERAQLQSRVSVLESELRRKHRRVRL